MLQLFYSYNFSKLLANFLFYSYFTVTVSTLGKFKAIFYFTVILQLQLQCQSNRRLFYFRFYSYITVMLMQNYSCNYKVRYRYSYVRMDGNIITISKARTT